MNLGVLDILRWAGFDPSRRVKLVRHQDSRYPVDELIRHSWLELYQQYQGKNRFHQLDYVVTFYALPGTRAAFYGVYRVGAVRPAAEGNVLPDCSWSSEWREEASFFYDLKPEERFADFRDRLIVDWGPATRSWVQRLSNKPVLEIRAPGRRLPPFRDYLEFTLTFPELLDLFANEEAHREWKARLQAVAGVYLILAEESGDLYVGSAYGVEGLWGRWREYAKTGHGGNDRLRALLERDSRYPTRFRFSLLHILPKTTAKDEVIKREALYKEKLGTRATGLNLN